jgi:hypothetical protein
MIHFKKSHLLLLLGLAAPASSFATDRFCIASDGGFGHGGTTYVGYGFDVPSENGCKPWSGFTKTAGTVVLITTGTACLDTDGKVLTVALSSADPAFVGATNVALDYITLKRSKSSGTFTSGNDNGYFNGSADQITCTSSLESLPASHD